MVQSGSQLDQRQVGTGIAEDAAHRKVIWWWTSKWMTVDERRFVEIEVPSFQMDRVLVACGIVDSRTNAQRLLKSNSISWRRDDGVMDWTKVTDFRQELEPGWPIVLKVGDGHWRTLQVEVEVIENPPFSAGKDVKPTVKKVTKSRSFPSLAVVMRPSEDQTIDVWTELWK